MLKTLAQVQYRRAATVVLGALLLAAAAFPLVARLKLNSDFTALLPAHKPSVRDLERVQNRTGGLNTLTLALQSRDAEALQKIARDLVPRLEAHQEHGLRSVEWNVAAYEDFVFAHRSLYADLEDLREIRASLEERLIYEKAKANPLFVMLDDEAPPEPEEVLERLRARADEQKQKLEKYPGGFYLHEDRDLLAIFLRTDIRGGDVETTKALMAWVEGEFAALKPSQYAPDMKLEFTGNLLHGREEHDAIVRELTIATSLTVALVLTVIFIFFRRFRAIPLMGISLAVPTLITFAFAQQAVEYLNTSTAFLGSIVVGNGINPNIIWLGRYFEERRAGRFVEDAILVTHQRTWLATITASMAAAIAYGSLVITDFRGFRDFGVIGGTGMVLCWLCAHGLLPSLAALYERFRPLPPAKARPGDRLTYGTPFLWLVFKSPRGVLLLSAVVGVAAMAVMAKAVIDDPIEYNFRNLRSTRVKSDRGTVLNRKVKQIVGSSGAGQAIAMVLDERDHAPAVRAQLERMRDEEGAPYGRVRSIEDLLPKEQQEKLPVLADIRQLLKDIRPYASEEQQKHIDEHIPPEELAPLGDADLPEQIARTFTERDGTRGRILFIEQKKGESLWDGRYLVRWASWLRKAEAPDGTRPPLAGEAPVFADMIEVVWTDGPKAVLASFLATFLLVSLAFRTGVQRFLSMGALLIGIVWMGGTMALLGMKLNFLNFVAFPVTFGNGVDYGVNVMRRFAYETREGGRAVADAVRVAVDETGGAVVLCSLTTIIGYSSLYVSANRALNSFGLAMAISEVTCLLAAVLAMPAALLWLDRRRAAREARASANS